MVSKMNLKTSSFSATLKDMIFEIGGRNKSFQQIKGAKDSYLVVDTDYTADNKKISLWLFGIM